MEKFNKSDYSRLAAEDESSQVSESVDLHYDQISVRRQQQNQYKSRIAYATIFIVYSMLLLYIPIRFQNRAQSQASIYPLLQDHVRYEPTTNLDTSDSPACGLIGEPSDELDANWSELMQNFFIEIPHSLAANLDRLDEGLQLPNGNYAATTAFMHNLHCVKRIYRSLHPARYFPNLTASETRRLQQHNLHCLFDIAQGIMCQPDTTPYTVRFLENSALPVGNRSIAHQCVDWGLLMRGMEQVRVDGFGEGGFVHPRFGAIVPDGRDTVLGDRVGFAEDVAPLDVKKWGHGGGEDDLKA